MLNQARVAYCQVAAIAASISGNGPAIAAIVKKENEQNVKKVFSSLDGSIIVSKINNKKAEVYEL